jgi:hypothetical protein
MDIVNNIFIWIIGLSAHLLINQIAFRLYISFKKYFGKYSFGAQELRLEKCLLFLSQKLVHKPWRISDHLFLFIAAIAGQDDPDFSSMEGILKKKPQKRSNYEKAQALMHNMVKSLGFWGILILASVSA